MSLEIFHILSIRKPNKKSLSKYEQVSKINSGIQSFAWR
jgi:hypothetical protein